jgi:hypothetical protein
LLGQLLIFDASKFRRNKSNRADAEEPKQSTAQAEKLARFAPIVYFSLYFEMGQLNV